MKEPKVPKDRKHPIKEGCELKSKLIEHWADTPLERPYKESDGGQLNKRSDSRVKPDS